MIENRADSTDQNLNRITMYVQINPQLILANFSRPLTISRFIRMMQYENYRKKQAKVM